MPRLTVTGGPVLEGTVCASGSKNAALPLLAASLLMEGEFTFHNVPNLDDTLTMVKMLNTLGISAETQSGNKVKLIPSKKIKHIAPYDLVTSMRASFFVAGPVLGRTGFAKVPMPGGCTIGSRPIDIHLKGFEALGAKIRLEHGFVELRAQRLKGTRIYLDFPSVGATENLMMAACYADGETVIENAAKEPEIQDLERFLNLCGAQVQGSGTSQIRVKGVSQLIGRDYHVMPDRIEAGTLLVAGAITRGDVLVNGAHAQDIEPLIQKLRECGFKLDVQDTSVRVTYNGQVKPTLIETLPFPGFPTDMQAQMMSLLVLANGNSVVKETIFENRFRHAHELVRMGAHIQIDGGTAFISGVKQLNGAEVKITDLRAGAALILAGLVADGDTTVYGMKHLYRGYDGLPEKLKSLGARFKD